MRHLGRRVAAKVADAVGAPVGGVGQLGSAEAGRADRVGLAEVVVLAEQAVYGAGGVEDGQVVLAALCMSGADGIGDAVGGQRIAVPVEEAPVGGAG